MNSFIIITGGSGYIGSSITYAALEAGYKVLNLDLESVGKYNIVRNNNYYSIKYDLSSNENYNKLINDIRLIIKDVKVEALIHMAAWKDLNRSFEIPLEYFDNNVRSTLNALHIAQEFKVTKFIFSSTSAVYDDNLSGAVEEDSLVNPSSPYGKSKLIGEILISSSLEGTNIQPVIFRYCNPIGSYKKLTLDTSESMFGNIYKSIKNKTVFKIFGSDYPTEDGTPVRDYIGMTSLVEAHMDVLKIDNKEFKDKYIINLGSGVPMTCLQVCNKVKELVYDFQFELSDPRPGDAAGSYSSNAVAKELNLNVGSTLEEDIESIIQIISDEYDDDRFE